MEAGQEEVEQYLAKLKALQDSQAEKTESLKSLRKDPAAKAQVDALLEQLKGIKDQIKVVQAEMKSKGIAPKPTPKGGNQSAQAAKEERARKAEEDRKKKEKFVAEIEIDKRDVTQEVLSSPFAGTRFHPETKLTPIPGKRNILITSALPYVNNVPHLGNLIGCVLSADVFARYSRLRGVNTLFICGTDEYGTATETKALQEGMSPQQVCDKYSAIHDEIYKWFGISFDHFGRTTTKQQTEIAQDIFMKLYANKRLVEQTVPQLLCPSCSRHLADRYVEGTCPKCEYPEARGDQCDKCGSLLNAIELINPRCKLDGATPSLVDSTHLYINLPELTEDLKKWVDKSSTEGKWSENGIAITHSWINAGLQPRCITRDLKWGTPVPLDGFRDKVFYVWFDAPIGYISITANYTEDWAKWWKNPKDVQLYQFMGKDNVPFHTVVFPSSLIGTGEDWTLLHHLSTTDYLNYEGKDRVKVKFSKSRGVGVFGDTAQKTNIPQEVWRYCLLVNRPESTDTLFSWDDFGEKANKELLANLGNFCNRCLKFTESSFESIIPGLGAALSDADNAFIQGVNAQMKLYIDAMDNVHIKEALRIVVIEIATLGNAYLQDNKPWELIRKEKTTAKKIYNKKGEAVVRTPEEEKQDSEKDAAAVVDAAANKERCKTIMNVAMNAAYLLAVLLEPFMPSFTEKLLAQMQLPHSLIPDTFELNLVPAGHKLGKSLPIFRELKASEVEELRVRFG